MSLKRSIGIAVLAVLFASGPFAFDAMAGAAEGRKTFEAKKCAGCHQTAGPAKEKTIKDQLAKKGPELWYSGSKFKPGFLEGWLKDPRPIRPLEYNSLTAKNAGSHPRLEAGDAADVAAYLMTLKPAEAKAFGIQAKDNPKGRVVFIKKYACYGCHEVKVRGTTAGGLSGPRLAGASARLQPDWIYAYMTNPAAFKPVKDMPNYTGIITEPEMQALAAYVASLE